MTLITSGLRFRARHFMKRFIYTRLIWDGHELTAFDEANQPNGTAEFVPGSPAHRAFLHLLDACQGVAPFEEESV